MFVETICRVRRTFTLVVAALVFSSTVEAAVLNIVAIGASNTSGWGVGSQNAYPAQLQTLLRKKGIRANVINAGVLGDTTAGMLRRLDSAAPKGTNIVILQPGANDLRFGFSKEQRTANIAAMVKRLHARDIRVIVFDPEIPADFYQWDHIHFNAAAHAKIAATLAAEIAQNPIAPPATPIIAQPASPSPESGPSLRDHGRVNQGGHQ
jgi:acyl-CoA thioesterase-1